MACRAGRWLCKRLGRRGVVLAIIGVGEVCWGLSFLLEPPSDRGLTLLTRLCGLEHWAWLWIGAGVATGGCALLRIGRDWAGFAAAVVPPIVWATAYAAAAAGGDYSRGGYVAAWYLTSHVGVIMWAATVPEHSVPPPARSRKGKAV